jgi:uncharacterized protein YeaO (DUF488 family)
MPILTAKHCRVEPSPEDGTRILVMRFWPRGVRRDRVAAWSRDLAPSPRLLGQFRARLAEPGLSEAAREAAWRDFVARYRAEMVTQDAAIAELRRRHAAGETITLLCACHDPARCHRTVLAELILRPRSDPAAAECGPP